MKFSQRLLVFKNRCPQELFESFVRLYPEGYLGGGSLLITAEPGNETLVKLINDIVTTCKHHNLQQETIQTRGGAFEHRICHVYEASDFDTAPLLWLLVQRKFFKHLNAGQRDELGRVWLPASDAKPSVKIGNVDNVSWIVVSDKVRGIMERGGLTCVKFAEVSIKGHSIYASPDPFWELRSTTALPKMSNSVPNPHLHSDPINYLIQDMYVEPHYRKSELEALGSFDIAHTFEHLSNGGPGLVVSQRFYQHCLKNKIPLEVRPARIDPD